MINNANGDLGPQSRCPSRSHSSNTERIELAIGQQLDATATPTHNLLKPPPMACCTMSLFEPRSAQLHRRSNLLD